MPEKRQYLGSLVQGYIRHDQLAVLAASQPRQQALRSMVRGTAAFLAVVPIPPSLLKFHQIQQLLHVSCEGSGREGTDEQWRSADKTKQQLMYISNG